MSPFHYHGRVVEVWRAREAPLDKKARAKVLERLWEAFQEDAMPYIETLGDHWGELCASPDVASEWADRLIGTVRLAWSPDPNLRGFFKGTFPCLSALQAAGRYEDLLELLDEAPYVWWHYRKWGVQALVALGRKAEALRYPHLPPEKVLRDLADSTPGEEGKWFAAAKEAGLFDMAMELAMRSPPDPRTLTRAARDFAEENPDFAVDAGVAALHWLVEGYGYENSNIDVRDAYNQTMKAAEAAGHLQETRQRIKALVAAETFGERFVTKVLGKELGLA